MILAAALSIIFVAGVLRGLTGFGFALVAAIGLGQFWPPGTVTPLVLLLELALTALLLRGGIFARADAGRLAPLCAGGAAGIAVGTALAVVLPQPALKPALDLAVFASAAVTLLQPRGDWLGRRATAIGVGFVFGTLAAAFAVGGPFVVVWFLGLGLPPAAVRANLILYFGAADAVAVVARTLTIGLSAETFTTALMLLPAALAGAFLGEKLFHRVDPVHWRRIAATAIAGGALVSLGRSVFQVL